MLDLTDRLNGTIINIFKIPKENIVLKITQIGNFSRKRNQMDLVELEKYSNRNKEFTGGSYRNERGKSQ